MGETYPTPTLKSVLETLQSTSPPRRLPKEIEEKFFACLKLGNGTAKTTYARRLDDVNETSNSLLPTDRPLEIMDVGISSGVSTLEWVDSLERRGIEYHMTAVDLMISGLLIGLRDGIDVLTDTAGKPLLIDLHGKWVPYPPGKRHLIRHGLSILAVRTVLSFIAADAVASASNEQHAPVGKKWFTSRPVPLVYSALVCNPRVSVIRGDLLQQSSLPTGLHAIRAANILNRSYFSDRQLSTIVSNLCVKLRDGGILIICRTDDDGKTAGTVFTKKSSGTVGVAARINGGSEVEELVQKLSQAV